MANVLEKTKLVADYAGWAGLFSKRENALVSRNFMLARLDSAYTIAANDGITHVNVDATAGAVTVTLPKASLSEGRVIRFRKIQGTNNMVIAADSADGSAVVADTAAAAANFTIATAGDYAFYCNGTLWYRVG